MVTQQVNNNLLEQFCCLLQAQHHAIDFKSLQALTATPSVNLNDLEQMASQLHFRANIIKQPWNKLLLTESLPLLLQCKNGQATTLLHIENNQAIVAELTSTGTSKQRFHSLENLEQEYAGIAFSIEPIIDVLAKSGESHLFSEFTKKEFVWRLFEIFLASSIIGVFQLALPLFTMNVYDKVIPHAAEDTLWVLASGIVLVFIMEYALRSTRLHILESLSQRIAKAMDLQLFRKLMGQPRQIEESIGVNTELFQEMQGFRQSFFSKILVDLIELPVIFLFLFVIYLISPALTFIPIMTGIVAVIVHFIHYIPITKLGGELFVYRRQRENFLIETLQGNESIQLSNAFARFIKFWQAQLSHGMNLARKSQLWNGNLSNITPIMVQSVSVLVIFFGAFQIFGGQLSVGGLIAVSILSARSILPILNCSSALVRLYSSMPMIRQWRKTLKKSGIYDDTLSLANSSKKTGLLQFKAVSFSYAGSSRNHVENISFTITPGEHIAVIGRSGAGKSTLLRLAAGLETPQQGHILLESYNLKDLHTLEQHNHISFMPQNPSFFAGTLRDNINLNKHPDGDIFLQNIIKDLEIADLMDNVSDSGLGFNVGDRGNRLSGGQKQLVALMRALIGNHSIYLLDEPTSGIDSGLELQIINYLKEKLRSKTLILVTHRSSLFALVDRMIVFEGGKIVADGPKEEILQQFYKTQAPMNNGAWSDRV